MESRGATLWCGGSSEEVRHACTADCVGGGRWIRTRARGRAAVNGTTSEHRDRRRSAPGAEKSLALAHVFGRLHGAAPQPAEAIDAAECCGAGAAMVIPDGCARVPGARSREFS